MPARNGKAATPSRGTMSQPATMEHARATPRSCRDRGRGEESSDDGDRLRVCEGRAARAHGDLRAGDLEADPVARLARAGQRRRHRAFWDAVRILVDAPNG